MAAILCTWGDLPDAAEAEFVTDASCFATALETQRWFEFWHDAGLSC